MKDAPTVELVEYGIAKIELGPQDILILKCKRRLSGEETARIGAIINAALRRVGMEGHPFLVIDDQFDIEKVTKQ